MKNLVFSILFLIIGLTLFLVPVNVLAQNQALDQQNLENKVTIKFWEADEAKIDEEILDPLIKKFEENNPQITVERTHAGTVEDLRQNTQTAFMGGQGPDLVLSPFDHIGPFSIMGIAQPLDNLASNELKNKFIKSALPGMSLNGNLYGIPLTMGNHLMLMYNKKMVKNAPTTWSELIKIAQAQTIDRNGDGLNDQYGLAYNLNEPFWWVAFQGGLGGWVFDSNYQPTLNTKATVAALQFVHDLKYKYKIVPKESDDQLADSLFKEGNVAFIINGDWALDSYRNNENIELGVAPIPKFEATNKFGQPMTSGKGFIMLTDLNQEKQIAVLKFIDFMTNIAAQELFVNNNFLPSNSAAYQLPQIQNDPIMLGSAQQLRNGRAMPVIPEMRGIWDAIRPALQSVMSNDLSPKAAAKQMQQAAEENIKGMR
ncbi:extracellular solute-binding protein [Halanaerobium salsuginis]|uniref:Arabinogalactan oligomer / maltooligosaccharide transport system substrate-binding protein n=1 Tax=Halanaerobium salsuginis TaxID=29563 RepID=A0A1I4M4H9_9FIRM|nr:extracellular solute-binding protein [Halanaerobium salsuginis]SFL97897.1 arabinogalactan oligomer / maltooligosaccharide transport system substrate-binding protein [Halanaerobium salsuginis]